MNKYLKESVLWAFMALPYIYLATMWDKLPERVPIHFNIEGNANGWSDKIMLPFVPAGLAIGIYLLMLLIPVLDPKKRIQQMGSKYDTFRLMLTFFFSLLSIYLLYVTNKGSLKNPGILFALIGGLLAGFGNYFQTLRPNYFIGIRTPWTLESERVWKKTHQLGGRVWMIGGILIVIMSFMITGNQTVTYIFIALLLIMVFVPVVYSYIEFKKEKILKQ